MYIRMFIAVFAFLMFPVGETVLHALPWCGCGYCYMAATGVCTCGPPYRYCLEDMRTLEVTAPNDNHREDVGSILNGVTSAFTKSDVTWEVMTLMTGGKCLHDKVTFSLLRNVRETLELVPVRFNEKT